MATLNLVVKWVSESHGKPWWPYWPAYSSAAQALVILVMLVLSVTRPTTSKKWPDASAAVCQFQVWWCLSLASFLSLYLLLTACAARDCRHDAALADAGKTTTVASHAELVTNKWWAAVALDSKAVAEAACPTYLPRAAQVRHLRRVYSAVGLPSASINADVDSVAGGTDALAAGRAIVVIESFIANLINAFLLLCFAVLYLRRAVSLPVAILVCTGCLLIPSAVGLAEFSAAGAWPLVVSMVDCLIGAVSIALLVGRLDSRVINPPLPLMAILYAYAAIQPFGAFAGTMAQVSRAIWPAFLILALAGKATLFLVIYWATDSGVLLYYMQRGASDLSAIDKERAAFFAKLTASVRSPKRQTETDGPAVTPP